MKALFGYEEQQAGWRATGSLSEKEVCELADEIVAAVGMNPDGPPIVDHYPKFGRGGIGIQAYQKLFESWLIISTWPTHGFIRINLSSCKPFEPDIVEDLLTRKVGRIEKKWRGKL